MSQYDKILVAIDLSEESTQVVERGRSIANHDGAELHLLHVIEPLSFAYGGDIPMDFSGIQDEMRARMLESGRFRIVAADQGQGEIADQVLFQQGTGIVDPATAKAFGSQVGADMIIYGTLRSIEKERDRSIASGGVKTELLDYQFALTAADITTGEQLWAKTEYIRKVEKRGLFGR